eukprot:gene24189-biopygen2888
MRRGCLEGARSHTVPFPPLQSQRAACAPMPGGCLLGLWALPAWPDPHTEDTRTPPGGVVGWRLRHRASQRRGAVKMQNRSKAHHQAAARWNPTEQNNVRAMPAGRQDREKDTLESYGCRAELQVHSGVADLDPSETPPTRMRTAVAGSRVLSADHSPRESTAPRRQQLHFCDARACLLEPLWQFGRACAARGARDAAPSASKVAHYSVRCYFVRCLFGDPPNVLLSGAVVACGAILFGGSLCCPGVILFGGVPTGSGLMMRFAAVLHFYSTSPLARAVPQAPANDPPRGGPRVLCVGVRPRRQRPQAQKAPAGHRRTGSPLRLERRKWDSVRPRALQTAPPHMDSGKGKGRVLCCV